MIFNLTKYLFVLVASMAFFIEAKAQCTVSITPSTTTVPCNGGQVTLTASATGGSSSVLNEDFNSGSVGSGWSVSASGKFNNPCDASYDGNTYMWMGNTTAAPRNMTTVGFDLSCGAEVCFYLDYATQGGSSPCEGPDLSDEGVNFEYSTDGGNTWTLIHYFNPNGGYDATLTSWNQYCYTIPPGAETTNTMFHWYQGGSSGNCCDHWGIDDVTINAVDCSSFWYDWAQVPGTTGPAGDNPVQVVNVSSDTTYEVTYTDGAGTACSNTVTIDVLDVQADFTSTNVCESQQSQFTDASVGNGDNIVGWEWDFDNDGVVDNTTQNPGNVFPSIGNYNVTLSVTSSGGCTDQITQTVEVFPVPQVAFTQTDVCDGTQMDFTDQTTIASGSIASWSWDFGDASGTSTNQNASYTYSTYGNYDVQLSTTSDNGCTDSEIISVTVNQNPTADFVVNDVCDGEDYILLDSSVPVAGNPITLWEWDFENDGNVDYSGQNTTHLYSSSGNYDVTLSIEDQMGCTNTITQTIEVFDLPVPNFTVPEVCEGASTQYTDNSSSTDGTIDFWDWDFSSDGSVDNTQQNPSQILGIAGTYNTTLTVTSSLGCVNTVTIPALVNPNPVAEYSWADVCDGEVMSFQDLSSVSTGSISSYQWDFGDFSGSDTQQNTSYTYASYGQYDVVLAVVTDKGCIDSKTHQVEVFQNPTVSYSSSYECLGVPITFQDNSDIHGANSATYSWDFNSDGTVDLTGPVNDYVYPNSGNYMANLTVVTNNGCSESYTEEIIVFPKPVASFVGQDVCENFAVDFSNYSNVSSGSITSQFWDFGNGNTSTQAEPSEVYSNEGIYTVMLEVTTDNGCVASTTETVDIYPTPVPQFVVADVCDGTIVNFTDFSNVSNTYTNNSIVDWLWDFGTNPTSGTQGQFASKLYNGPGTYTVTLDVTTNHGCENSYQSDVVVYPNPDVNFESPNPDGCTEWCPIITNSSTISSGMNNSYFWDLGDGTVSTDEFPVHCFTNGTLADVSYNVSLTVTSDFGCVTTVTENNFITVYPEPVAEFEHDPIEGDIYNPTIEFINQSLIADMYDWTFDNLGTSSLENPSFTFPDQDSGVYVICLNVETIHGCTSDTCHEVGIKGYSNLYVPNAFTPDGDGVNDSFMPSVYGFSEEGYQFMVFDRWGTLIFSTTNLNDAWDGTYLGQDCMLDTYVWKLKAEDKYNGDIISHMGHVNLIR